MSSLSPPIAPDTTALSFPGNLEQAIDSAALWLMTAQTKGDRVAAWGALQNLCSRRSQERVREMEIERGLL